MLGWPASSILYNIGYCFMWVVGGSGTGWVWVILGSGRLVAEVGWVGWVGWLGIGWPSCGWRSRVLGGFFFGGDRGGWADGEWWLALVVG